MSKITDNIELFRDIDNETRLQLLFDYSQKLPPVPANYQTIEQLKTHRIPECQTPVSLWVDVSNNGKVHIYADVPRESPTVRGFLSLLIDSFDDVSVNEVEDAPGDILQQTGLDSALGMMRMQGLTAIYKRIKDQTHRLGTNFGEDQH